MRNRGYVGRVRNDFETNFPSHYDANEIYTYYYIIYIARFLRVMEYFDELL